ncbi:polysaccharide pyruvyl transferase family protein [Ensifer soli]|uniref:polysaccharide pyruvyl transferase family protein n=1 Tax=Ciceribacter sp. sgz301302 TaxID=3342379 RepID=UPI0035B9C808
MVFARAREFFRVHKTPALGCVKAEEDGSAPSIRLSWVWTTAQHPDVNLGDALSAVMVSAIAGLPVERASFGQKAERLAAVGTIGHAQHNGIVHFWGTGFDLKRDWHGALTGYRVPADTELRIHAVRGRQTGQYLRGLGLDVPEIYGDPVWFLPRLFPFHDLGKDRELGVIVHISELDEATAAGRVKASLVRYGLPAELAASIRIINTYAPASMAAMEAKIAEIVSCRRILSTSLHGLVIAETYGIPCAWFATYAGQSGYFANDGDRPIDHRMIDFYGGADREAVLTYCQPLHQPTDWDDAISFIDQNWTPLDYDGKALFDAFPLKRAVRFSQKVWRRKPELLENNPY